MLGDINPNLPLPLPQVFLVKTDGTILGKIEGRSGIAASKFGRRKKLISHTQLFKLGGISEMEFSIPFMTEINHELVRNPIIDLVRIGYYLKVLFNNTVEFYIITDITNSMDDQKDIKLVKSKSLGYELIYRQIHNWNVISQNLSSLLNGGTSLDSLGNSFSFSGILSGTLWTLDPSYDVTFDTMYRKFSFSQVTVLDALNQIALAMGAVLSFDTINRRINFQQLKNIGQNRGFKINYKNYLRSVTNENNGDGLVTRFRPIGASGLTISSVNANGLEYIDNFDWFLYPFSRDVSRNVIQSSYYFSDNLSHALLDYEALLALHQGDYATLLATLSSQQSTLTTKQNDMATLATGLKSINAQLDIAQTTGQPTATLLSQQAAQNALIATKQTEINTANANIASTNSSIATLQATLSTSANFTAVEINELSKYIRQKDWNDNSISDASSLLSQGLLEFQKVNAPSITVKVDLINLFEVIESQRDFDKLNLGDIIEIEYDVISTSVSARIAEIQFDHQNSNLTLTISNVTNLKRDEERVFSMLFQGINANSSLSVNTDRWNGIDQTSANINAIYTNGIAASKIAINSAVNNSVLVNERGITISDSSNANKFIRITNGVIGLSQDGGNTFSTAIDAVSIKAPLIVGQLGSFVTLSANSITTGSLSGINMSIGTGNNVFVASSNGIQLGHSVFGSAPFRVDMTGNAWATSMQLSQPSITNGSIVGSTINIGSGAFTVSNLGAVVCSNLTLTGGSITWSNINTNPAVTTAQNTANNAQTIAQQIAAGTYSGGTFISGTQIFSPTVTGGIVQTGSSGRRIVMSGNKMDSYDGNGVRRISLNNDGVAANCSISFFRDNSYGNVLSTYMYQTGTQFVINAGSDTITYFGNVDFLNATVSNMNMIGSPTISGNLIATQNWVNSSAIVTAKFG